MDWLTFTVSTVVALLSGGGIGGAVALVVSKREQKDRQDALALEREKWEHERTQPIRDAQREALLRATDLVSRADLFEAGLRKNGTLDDAGKKYLADLVECGTALQAVTLKNEGAEVLVLALCFNEYIASLSDDSSVAVAALRDAKQQAAMHLHLALHNKT